MPEAIAAFCRETGQPVPRGVGAFVRCALESLALVYRRTIGELQEVTGKPIQRLHIVGGGSRNALLNQLTADAAGIPVLAGPEEATAAGNVLVQAVTLGHLPSLGAARGVVRRSFPIRRFQPRRSSAWRLAATRFERWTAGPLGVDSGLGDGRGRGAPRHSSRQ
jgi:rhamnulokinase